MQTSRPAPPTTPPPSAGGGPVATFGEVVEVRQLTPRLIRVVLGGEGLASFAPTEWSDQYVNALFVPEGAPYGVPFDVDAARSGARGHRPIGRRYTVRWWDADARRLALDFVVHGDTGVAGRWATHAAPGDRLQMLGPNGGYAPDPDADGHLMVGDESALPAIAASLERVPAGRPAVVVVVVDDADHELALASPGDVDLTWVHRVDAPGDARQLLRVVEALTLPEGRVQAFVHGEAGEVRAVRRHLLADRGFAKAGGSISPYWRRDYTDERWREVKAEWLASCETDA
jgi:NADPH-dependent ferric siderophore reductase